MMSETTKYADRVALQLEAQKKEQLIRDAKAIQTKQLLDNGLQRAWQELISSVRGKCEEINTDERLTICLAFEQPEEWQLRVSGPSGLLVAEAHLDIWTIEIRPQGCNLRYRRRWMVNLGSGGVTVQWCSALNDLIVGMHQSWEEIAEEMLNVLLGLRRVT